MSVVILNITGNVCNFENKFSKNLKEKRLILKKDENSWTETNFHGMI